MIPVLTDLRNAYEAHDREAFDRHLKRVEEMLRYTGPTRHAAPGATGNCIHCGKECCNEFGWCNSYRTR